MDKHAVRIAIVEIVKTKKREKSKQKSHTNLAAIAQKRSASRNIVNAYKTGNAVEKDAAVSIVKIGLLLIFPETDFYQSFTHG